MRLRPLSETLTELIGGLALAADAPGLSVTDADFDLPVEVRLAVGPDGPELLAEPTAVRWRTGFEPVIHRLRLTAVSDTGGSW